jgi:IS5 family transposase
MTRYGLERLVSRLSVSPHAQELLLKGALLLAFWFDAPHRPTRDADFLGFGPDDPGTITARFREICAIEADHDIAFEGTIVDATIIQVPPSTKYKRKTRDPKTHQTNKGNRWHFGMKAHIGVEMESGLVHALTTTTANLLDVIQPQDLLHGKKKRAYGDAGYTGADEREQAEGSAWRGTWPRSAAKRRHCQKERTTTRRCGWNTRRRRCARKWSILSGW